MAELIPAVESFDVPGVGIVHDLRLMHEQAVIDARAEFARVLHENMKQQDLGAQLCNTAKRRVRGHEGEKEVALGIQGGDLKPLGMLVLYGCQIESERDRVLQVRAFPAPGMSAAGKLTMEETVAAVMRYVLDTELDLVDGRRLDVVQWDFPEEPGEQWIGHPVSTAVISDGMSRDDEVVYRDSVPRTMRRKGAPSELGS